MEEQQEDQTLTSLILSIQNLALSDQKPVTVSSSSQSPLALPPASELPSLEEVEEVTGYYFRNKELLKEAFTDASYKAVDCVSYERLEYLGDSVLNHLIAKLHYLRYPEMAPGELTRLRAANVDTEAVAELEKFRHCTEALARAALKYDLHKFLRHRKPLLDGQIQEFMEGIVEYPSHSHGMIDPPKVLADILESLIGAIFIDTDSSMDATWEVIERLLQPLITPENLKLHPVAKFNEACQKMGLKPQAKDMWNKTGEVEIYVDNELIGRGKYKLKKMIAVNRAADDAYKNLFEKLGNKDGSDGG